MLIPNLLFILLYISCLIGIDYTTKRNAPFSIHSLIFRIYLVSLDLLLLNLITFTNNYSSINRTPMILSFSILFYYIIRDILRNNQNYQYIIHLYHPNIIITKFNGYYTGIRYNLIELLIKYLIISTFLYQHVFYAYMFLCIVMSVDLCVYYMNISDSSHEIFQRTIGFLFNMKNKE
jgi:hypothetical protein